MNVINERFHLHRSVLKEDCQEIISITSPTHIPAAIAKIFFITAAYSVP